MKGFRKLLITLLLSLFAFSILGCTEEYINPTGDSVGSFRSYKQLKDYIEEVMKDSSNQTYGSVDFEMQESEDAIPGADAPSYDADDGERDYSKTNNQVEGVEEADTILTDGYKIYIVSGSKFFIIDADTLEIDYTLEKKDSYFSQMFLYNHQVVLISQTYMYEEDICTYSDNIYDKDSGEPASDNSEESTDSEDQTFICYTYTYGTEINVLDVTDSKNVIVDRTLYFDSSSTITSRMIDENLYLILNNYMYHFDGDEAEDFVPKYMDSVVSDDLEMLPANRIFFMPTGQDNFAFLTLVSLDITSDEAADVKAYLGSTWQVYMSQHNLYAVIQQWEYLETEGIYDYQTFIVRFEIENDVLSYKALGEIEGSPLNQFSMDEYDGVFRIFTTGYAYSADEWKIDNFLFMLDATTEDEMTRLSVLGNLGKPGERIYSARFSETYGYVVTFEQIDPLYKIDLSDPTQPEVIGQLEEEGVSDYLHEITDTLMIGVGRQAESSDGWTRFTGVKVSLYDTSGDSVINLEDYLVEGAYSYTNVMWDHKAFLEFTPKGADFTYIGIPVYEYFVDFYGYSQSLYLFKVYHSGELNLVTKLTHMVEEEGYYRYFDSIERALIIENNVYTVSYSSIKMFDMTDHFTMVNETELNPNYYGIYGYPETTADDEAMND